MSKNRITIMPEYLGYVQHGLGFKIRTRWKSRNSALAPALAPALPTNNNNNNNNNNNDNILDNDDDDFLSIDEPTAVSNVSFSMDSHDRESYKSDVSVTFGFTPTTASPSYVKLNYRCQFLKIK